MSPVTFTNSPRLRCLSLGSALALSISLAACGGGGSGASSATAIPLSLATSTAPAVFPRAVQATVPLSPSSWQVVAAAVARLPASTGPTWVHIFTTGTQGELVTLALLSWDPTQTPPVVQPPATGSGLRFDAYNAAGSVTGNL